MITAVLGFFTGSWKWLIAIAATAAALYGYGYHAGSTSELRLINKAQQEEMERAIMQLETFHQAAIGIMRDVADTNAELNENVQNIQRPTISTCTLPDNWVLAYAASVRAANNARASARADAGTD